MRTVLRAVIGLVILAVAIDGLGLAALAAAEKP